eukprot:6192942-Prymnesium_polylepis.1
MLGLRQQPTLCNGVRAGAPHGPSDGRLFRGRASHDLCACARACPVLFRCVHTIGLVLFVT